MRKLFLSLCLSTVTLGAVAQSIDSKTIFAFENSYKAENNKHYDQAIQDLKGVYQEQSYEINLRLGWLYYSKKDYAQSVKYYQAAIKNQPSSIEAMLGLVNPEAAMENWNSVLETYKKILTIDPNNSTANYRIALMYFYRKDFASAQTHLNKVLNLYPFDYSSMLLMAQTKIAAGKLTEGKQWYEKVLLYNPGDTAIKTVLSRL